MSHDEWIFTCESSVIYTTIDKLDSYLKTNMIDF